MSILPPSTFTVFMKSAASSARCPSFFCSQLLIAESKSFSRRPAASLLENLRMFSASWTFFPRMISATNLILRGDVGQLFNLAKEICLCSSLRATALSCFREPIVYSFQFGLPFLISRVTSETPRRGELTEFMSDHILSHINRNERFSIMHRYCHTHKIRCDGRCSGPSLDHRFLSAGLRFSYSLSKLVVHKRWFF